MGFDSRKVQLNQIGFTLIEILISIVILAFMATMTGVSISKSIKIKAKVEKEMDDDAQLREVVAIMTKDINLAFHWTDPQEILKQQVIQDTVSQGKPNPYPVTGNIDLVAADKLTAFVGDASSLYFSTLTNERQFKDSHESDQAKVGYFLKDTKSYKDKKMTKSLVRRVAPYLDGDVTQGGRETVLIENIKTLKFRFLPDDIKEITDTVWLDTWKNYETLDEKMRNKFPAAVEVHIVVERDKRVSDINTIIALHSTGNTPFQFSGNTTPSGSPSPGASGTPGQNTVPAGTIPAGTGR